MSDASANEMRLIANEVCRRLYLKGEAEQLTILKSYIESCLEQLRKQAPTPEAKERT